MTGSANSADPSWSAVAQKLIPAGGAGTGLLGHAKTVEAMKWMAQNYADTSYYVPAHLERAGPFNPNGNNGFNIEHLRNLNNAAPTVAFGFESQPGHGASDARGEYTVHRNNFGGTIGNVDSVGGTTWGGTGVYAGQVGGVWDALLGEGRNWWFFASSDWHNRGMFGPDDRRSSQDFFPGEYQRTYVKVGEADRASKGKVLTPDAIVDGLRTGNSFASQWPAHRPPGLRGLRGHAHQQCDRQRCWWKRPPWSPPKRIPTSISTPIARLLGEKLVVRPGSEVVVAIVVRDPSGANYSPYTFPNPSLAQVGISQPLNKPVLDHLDVIGGSVTGTRCLARLTTPVQWPNTWLSNPDLATVPAGAKNTTARTLRTFGQGTWHNVPGDKQYKAMVFRLRGLDQSQYLRLRGTNLPAAVPFETDADGNPLADLWTNATAINPTLPGGTDGTPANANLRIPCTTVGTNVPDTAITYTGTTIDGCPAHLPVVNGQKYSAYDVAAWSDLWFYSNPVFIEVQGSSLVAGVK